MKIYTLHHDRNHSGDDIYDAELLDKKLDETISGFTFPENIEVPKPIYFQANFNTLSSSDFPICDVTWLIISKKILKKLLSIKYFNHQVIPITMLDDTELDEKYFDENRKPYPKFCNNDFICLHLLEQIDAFDWDKSVYKMHRRIKNRADMIRKLVFKEPEGGFPPVFRLSAHPTYVYFSETAKTALEAADIKGVIFEEA